MRRTASSTRRVGWRATASSAVYSRNPPGNWVWWMYFLSCHFLPVSRTFSAFTTTTKSPQSACGVKIGLCLPRRTLAMVVAARPSTSSFTSMTTQLRWTVCLLPITVFMRPFSPKGGVLYWIRSSVSTFAALRILPGKEGVHVGEEAAGLARLRLPARRQRRAAQVDAVDQLGRQVVEEAAGRAGQQLAAPEPLRRPGQREPLAGPRHADVREPPLLLQVRYPVRGRLGRGVVEATPGVRQQALLKAAEENTAPFQAFGAVQRDQRDGVAGVAIHISRVQRQPGEVAGQAGREGAVLVRAGGRW